MHKEVTSQVADMAVKAAPPSLVAGLSFYGVSLPDIVSIGTLIYLVINTGYIIYKWRKATKAKED